MSKIIHSITLSCKVITKSSQQKIIWDADLNLWKIYIHDAPEKGKANQAICKLLANALDIPIHSIHIIQGLTTTRKIIQIVSLKYENEEMIFKKLTK